MRLRWAGHVARMVEKRNAYRILVETAERKRPLGRHWRRWEDNIVKCMCDFRRGMDWWMDLLTTYTHDWELHANTVPPLSSTIYKSPTKPFPACCVFTSRSLATASNSGGSLASRAQVLSSQPSVQNCLTTDFVPCLWHLSADHLETHRFQQYLYCCVHIRCRGNVFTEMLPRNNRCLQSHRLATCLHAEILKWILERMWYYGLDWSDSG
jgi:hypothetical protein